MKKFYFILLFTLLNIQFLLSQGIAGTFAKYEYRRLIDMPTAGVLERGMVGLSAELLPFGTVIAKIEAGVFDGLNIGLSYGGSNIIGAGNIDWYPFPPGVNLRYRLMIEDVLIPAVTIGFDTQGKGEYFKDEKRFSVKAPGLFAATSKNFSMLGYLSLHALLNYTVLEDEDGDNFVNLMVGAEKTIGENVSFIIEYNFAFNDNNTYDFGNGKGYLNLGVRWSFYNGATIGFDLRDLLKNKQTNPTAADRALYFEFIQKI